MFFFFRYILYIYMDEPAEYVIRQQMQYAFCNPLHFLIYAILSCIWVNAFAQGVMGLQSILGAGALPKSCMEMLNARKQWEISVCS